MKKPRILLIYDYFDPAMLAGGPVVSCANLVGYLNEEYDFYIFTTNRDLGNTKLPVKADEWLNYKHIAKIFYGSSYSRIIRYFSFINKEALKVIYINGIYSFVGVIIPLLVSAFFSKDTKLVIAPRGMLQANALNVKRLKKRIYLVFFRQLIAMNRVQWQVTSEEEHDDLLIFLGKEYSNCISLVGNVPSLTTTFSSRNRTRGVLSLLTIALISPMKNILMVIEGLKKIPEKVVYTLYGTIKEKAYWKRCIEAASNLPESITFVYGGIASRKNIPSILAEHDVYIQPSESENFSHSIYEALMSGMPVITSHNTPWQVTSSGAGWNVSGDDPREIASAVLEAAILDDEVYRKMCDKARKLGEEYLLQADLKARYSQLFG